jgi:hypothetical protein
MTNEQKVWIASILTTLLEVGDSPASQIYLAMGMDMHKWEVVRDLLVGSNMIKVSAGHLVSLTPNGRDLAVTINETLQSEASA